MPPLRIRYPHLALTIVLLLLAQAPLVPAQRLTKTLCVLPIADDIQTSMHAAHAVEYYRANFTFFNWNYVVLTSNELTAKNFVKTWVLDGTVCDFLVGPGYSFLAVAMSPLVEVPWVDPSATSTELSDKGNHPSFSRVIPTDEVGARSAAVVYDKMGWTRTNIFCSDEPYGRSVALGLSSSLSNAGGIIEVSRCLEASASGERVRDAIEAFLNSDTRVVFVAMLPFHRLFQSFITEALALNAQDRLSFFYSEAMCSSADRSYTRLLGGICATYRADPAIMQPFLNSYRSRDITAMRARLAALRFPPTLDIAQGTNIYAALAHDATLHAMHAINDHAATGSSMDIFTYLRNITTDGATGTIRLGANGDRGVVDGIVYNSQPNQTEVTVGTMQDGVLSWQGSSDASTPPDLSLFGQTVRSGSPIPSSRAPSSGADERNSLGLVLGLVFAIVVVAAVGLVVVSVVMRGNGVRDNTAAPKDQSEPFAMVFTDIQSSTSLWAREPQIMSDAVDKHHSAIRKLVRKYGGYEVKTLGDSFMVAFKKPQDAVALAVEIQTALFDLSWNDGGVIDDTYQELLMEAKVELPSNYSEVWRGIRVRVGVHYGSGSIQFDEVTKGYDYYGTVVNTAARVEAVGHGGQVVVTEAVYDALTKEKPPIEYKVVELGAQPLRGLDEPIRLYQISPKTALATRKFPPLRLDATADVDVEDDTHSAISVGSKYSHQSRASGASVGAVLDAQASKYARRAGLAGPQVMEYADRILELQAFVKVLLSTSNDSYRQKTVSHLAQKWRAAGNVTEDKLKSSKTYELALLDITTKVLRVSDAQHQQQQRLKKAGGAVQHDPVTSIPASPAESGEIVGESPSALELPTKEG